ncbi:unnamed protein product [Peniophora sp. CBMAI 1063]|nr:unnamed protein product [Peniophora sp. CBMAI 1063]
MSPQELQDGLAVSGGQYLTNHAGAISRLRSCLSELRGTPSTALTDAQGEGSCDSELRGLLANIFSALLVERDRNLSSLRARLLDGDISPSSPDYHDFPETYHHELRWNIWKLYGRIVLGILPPMICLINGLPLEILERIFGFTNRPSIGRDAGSLKITYVAQTWDASSHLPLRMVCKYWSHSVLGLPVVWSRMIQGFGDDWTRQALQRSRNCDLSIELDHRHFSRSMYGHHLLDSAQLILAHAPRFHLLVLNDLTWDALAQVTSSLGNVVMSRLATLAIIGQGHETRLPEHVFASVPPPVLRAFTAVNCRLYPACPVFRARLTRLILVRCEIWTSLDDMLDTLQDLPTLAHFDWRPSLSYALEGGRFLSATRHQSAVPLPHLRHVVLECPAGSFGAILQQLSLPAHCHIRVLDVHSMSGDHLHDPRVIEDVVHALDISVGVHCSRFHLPSRGSGIYSLALIDLMAFGPGTNAVLVHGSTTPDLPSDHLEHQSHIPDAFTFTIALCAPDSMAVNGERETVTLHDDIIRRVMEHILAWSSLRRTVRKLVTNYAALDLPQMWRPILLLVPQLVELHLGYSSISNDSSIVRGLAAALLADMNVVPSLRRVVLGPLAFLDADDRDELVDALARRHSSCGYPSLVVVLVNPEEWMEDDEIRELQTLIDAANVGRVEVEA